jgi:hypothetical protein
MDYIQIDRTNCMEIILLNFPAFQDRWDVYIADWHPSIPRPIALDISEFADFAIDTIWLQNEPEIAKIAATIETMLQQGDSIVEYAFRTMFLEQIAARSQRTGFNLDGFTSQLQPLGWYYWQDLDRHVSIHPFS